MEWAGGVLYARGRLRQYTISVSHVPTPQGPVGKVCCIFSVISWRVTLETLETLETTLGLCINSVMTDTGGLVS